MQPLIFPPGMFPPDVSPELVLMLTTTFVVSTDGVELAGRLRRGGREPATWPNSV